MTSASRSARPGRFVRTKIRAAATPMTMSSATAHTERISELRIAPAASGCSSAVRKCSRVHVWGRIVSYHPPGILIAESTTPMCGTQATKAIPPRSAQTPIVAPLPSGTSTRRTDALVDAAPRDRPSVYLPNRYAPVANVNITKVSAYGSRDDSISCRPSKICTLVTVLNPNMSGVPSSVKLHTNTIVAPAKKPGRSMGRVIRRKRCQREAPRLRAASSSAGSRFASEAARFSERIG